MLVWPRPLPATPKEIHMSIRATVADRRLRAASLLATIPLSISACGGESSPSNPNIPEPAPTLELVSGFSGSDTLGTIREEPLTVRAMKGSEPLTGATVRFLDVSDDGTSVWMASMTQPTGYMGAIFEPTDADGMASVSVKLLHAGPAKIEALLVDYDVADTAAYEIEPGQPVRRILSPVDPGVFVGGTVQFEPRVVDREFNTLPLQATVEVVSGPIALAGDNGVSGESLGTGVVTTSGEGTVADTTRVFVVPHGELVYSNYHDPVMVSVARLDGSDVRDVATSVVSPSISTWPEPVWHPDGDRIVYVDNFRPKTLYVASLTGAFAPHEIYGQGTDVEGPAVSPDGEWVYFGGNDRIWRVRIDGTEPEPVGASSGGQVESYPSPSPDGSRIVLQNDLQELHIKDVATGDIDSSFSVSGLWPSWSPDAEWIAFIADFDRNDSGRLMRVHPDGTGLQEIPTGGEVWEGPITWSPDSVWLLLEHRIRDGNTISGHSTVVNVETGQTIQLPEPPGAAASRAWRPE